MEKAREFQKNIYFCFIDYAKSFDCVDHSKLENLTITDLQIWQQLYVVQPALCLKVLSCSVPCHLTHSLVKSSLIRNPTFEYSQTSWCFPLGFMPSCPHACGPSYSEGSLSTVQRAGITLWRGLFLSRVVVPAPLRRPRPPHTLVLQ